MLYIFISVEIQEAADSLSHVDNGKISVSDLKSALKSLHTNLSEEDFRDTLEQCDIGGELPPFIFCLRISSFFLLLGNVEM